MEPLYEGGDSEKPLAAAHEIGAEEEGETVEILRDYLPGDPWDPECDEVRRGMLAICEELGFPCRVWDSAYFDNARRYMKRGFVICRRCTKMGCKLADKVSD